jgi:hypothetical protein
MKDRRHDEWSSVYSLWIDNKYLRNKKLIKQRRKLSEDRHKKDQKRFTFASVEET